ALCESSNRQGVRRAEDCCDCWIARHQFSQSRSPARHRVSHFDDAALPETDSALLQCFQCSVASCPGPIISLGLVRDNSKLTMTKPTKILGHSVHDLGIVDSDRRNPVTR